MLILPIRTQAEVPRAPVANLALIVANFAIFGILNLGVLDELLGDRGINLARYFMLETSSPKLYQFVTHMFAHADIWHLLGNMLFLWVFGNSVNAKLGQLPYVIFYLAGGVFASWAFAAIHPKPTHLVGASGAIASITTAYLVLYPKTRVLVLIWLFIFIRLIPVPAMLIIGLKIILWDNIVAPSIGGAGNVAHFAHLAGYAFGFTSALLLLLARGVPRDMYDILALFKRWRWRREYKTVMANPEGRARMQYGSVARLPDAEIEPAGPPDPQQQEIIELRRRLSELLSRGETTGAIALWQQLLEREPQHALPLREQMLIGRTLYQAARFPQAAAAFERFLALYREAPEAPEIRLLLGITYARELQQPQRALEHLSKALTVIQNADRRAQCRSWLKHVHESLGIPLPPELSDTNP
jgi:membrane associated rhomboid family serine protease